MNPVNLEQLAPPNAPEAWLAVISPGSEDYIVKVAAGEDELNIWELKKQWINWIRLGHNIVAMKDSPSLRVNYRGGLWACSDTPAVLTARKIWFLRYKAILEPHLCVPLPTIVHFYERKPLQDLFSTMRSTKDGPFPFPKHADWPRCGHCHEPMAFVGVLDFRQYHRISTIRVPGEALVLHGCDQCTIPCSDPESTSLTWITEKQQTELSETEKSGAVEVGVPWDTVEFPCPTYCATDLSNDPGFQKEWGIDLNFTCPLNKIGGHLGWIQNDNTPNDRNGNPMKYIGQFIGTRDVELGDGGIVYIFFSDETQETKAILQYY